MNKALLTFLTVSLVSSCLYAQSIEGGIKAGLNIADQSMISNGIDPGMVQDTKAIAGFQAGLFLNIMFSNKIGIQPELLYSMQGSKVIFLPRQSFDLKLTYLNIPILFRYNITNMVHLYVGPQIGFLMSAKETYRGTTHDLDNSNFKSTDFSLTFGEGVDLPCGIVAGLRYSLGLVTIQNSNSISYFDQIDVKNNNFQVYVGYKLLRKK